MIVSENDEGCHLSAESTARPEWWIDGAQKAQQSVTSDWTLVGRPSIEGVGVREIRSVLTSNGSLTEVFRRDWAADSRDMDQIVSTVLVPGAISAWHVHERATDRFFALSGLVRLVLYDSRERSTTCGRINEFLLGPSRPGLYTVPAGIWHGVQNISGGPAILLNVPDRAYCYEAPDHWTLPPDSPRIPYRFRSSTA